MFATNTKPYNLPADATWFITGCSSGIGKALAQHIASKPSHRLIATARNPSDLSYLPDKRTNILKLALNVTSPNAVSCAFKTTIDNFGTIDVLVNNAGYALSGDTESATEAESHEIMETNFFGTVRTTTAALPHMRVGGRGGLIINISSVAGVCAFPGHAFYHASKHAVEGWTESVAKEVSQDWDISFCIVEPAAVKTNFEGHSKKNTAPHPAYADPTMPTRVLQRYVDAGLKQGAGMESEDVASVIYEVASKGEKVPLHLPLSVNAFGLIKGAFEARLKALEEGGSVIKHILANSTLSKSFKIRGITRDISKPAAQALVKQGVELKTADLSDKASITEALQGSDVVFLVTNYWESAKYEVEFSQGKNVADASKELGVQHLIFSSLLHVGKITNSRLSHVPHFEAKADIEEYIKKIGVPASFYLPGYFMSNFTQSVQKGEDGSLSFAFPVRKDAKFPLIDIAEDTGKFVKAIIKNRDATLNKRIFGAENYYTPEQIRSGLEAATGEKTYYAQIPAEQYKGFLPGFIAEEMLQNHQFIGEPGYYNGADLMESHDIVEDKLVNWEDFIKKSGAFSRG